ncbi:MAG: dual specificity protein phosphatase family protein [bacterium]
MGESKKRFRKTRRIAVGLCIVLFLLASYEVYMKEQGNFHPVTPGVAYRSAQLEKDVMEYYVSKYGIRSVINLRGEHSGKEWYDQEMEVCRNFKIEHHDLKMSATEMPSLDMIEALISIFKTTPRPVLIHCKHGADRSGLAAAIWKMVIDGQPKLEAKKQLSIFFGHVSIGPTRVLDEFFEKWEPEKNVCDRAKAAETKD